MGGCEWKCGWGWDRNVDRDVMGMWMGLGWGCSSLVEHLPSIYTALSSIASTKRKKKKKEEKKKIL